jgi:hypothetical protein
MPAKSPYRLGHVSLIIPTLSNRPKAAQMRKLPALAAMPLALALAGCGTTVPQVSTFSQQSVAGADGLQAPKTQGSIPSNGSDTAPTTDSPNNVPIAVGPTAPAASVPTSSGTIQQGVAAGQPVKVGFVVASNSTDAAFKAAGVGALQVGDQHAQAQAVVDDINAHGGLAGHPIQPVFNTPDASASSYEQADSEQCAAFTQDAHVAFVISVLAHTPTLHDCLAKKGVTLLDDDLYLYDSKVVHPGYLFMPSGWLLDRLMRNEIDGLARMGFFKDPGRVGVLLYDLPIPKRVLQDTVLPLLAHYGKTQVDVATSSFDTASATNQQGNVLKFSNDHVTRIIDIAFNPIGFMASAESQQYHPRYALDSSVGPATIAGSVPPDQLNGMVGIGWIPSSDTGSGTPVTAAGQRCLALMKKEGQDTANSTTASLMEEFCDAGWFLQAATSAAADASVPGLQRGARLTKGFVSAASFATDMTSGRSDGLSGYRDFAYESGCRCVHYVGGIRSAS